MKSSRSITVNHPCLDKYFLQMNSNSIDSLTINYCNELKDIDTKKMKKHLANYHYQNKKLKNIAFKIKSNDSNNKKIINISSTVNKKNNDIVIKKIGNGDTFKGIRVIGHTPSNRKFEYFISITNNPNHTMNCHSFSCGLNEGWLHDPSPLFNDKKLFTPFSPKDLKDLEDGDIVYWKDKNNNYTHSGIIRKSEYGVQVDGQGKKTGYGTVPLYYQIEQMPGAESPYTEFLPLVDHDLDGWGPPHGFLRPRKSVTL